MQSPMRASVLQSSKACRQPFGSGVTQTLSRSKPIRYPASGRTARLLVSTVNGDVNFVPLRKKSEWVARGTRSETHTNVQRHPQASTWQAR